MEDSLSLAPAPWKSILEAWLAVGAAVGRILWLNSSCRQRVAAIVIVGDGVVYSLARRGGNFKFCNFEGVDTNSAVENLQNVGR